MESEESPPPLLELPDEVATMVGTAPKKRICTRKCIIIQFFFIKFRSLYRSLGIGIVDLHSFLCIIFLDDPLNYCRYSPPDANI